MEYSYGLSKKSTLKNDLGVKVNDFPKSKVILNVRTFIYSELAQLKRYLLLFKAAIFKGINKPLAIFNAGSRATSYPS